MHAALLVGSVANQGRMMKPYVVERVEHKSHGLVYSAKEQVLRDVVMPSTANKLMKAMGSTVTTGTARRQFRRFRSALKQPIDVAAKTGTLSGKNPEGRYHWFVAAAPADNPEIAVASLVIDPGHARINGTGIARLFMQHYFKNQSHS
jgi:cell division protein FtsI/penicillin-binding protein 2